MFTTALNAASALGGWAVDAYRARLQAQLEQRRLAALQLNMLASASLASVGMITDVVAMQLRIRALQLAMEQAIDADDIERAEVLRAQLTSLLQDPPASARLLATLAEYIPALVTQHNGGSGRIIEGRLAGVQEQDSNPR